MSTLKLNENLLLVICCFKSKQQHLLDESLLAQAQKDMGEESPFTTDWVAALKEYYNALPDSLFDRTGLKRNAFCFQALKHLEIPTEWTTAPMDQLDQFTFSF